MYSNHILPEMHSSASYGKVKKIFVTGASGFLGSSIISEVINYNIEVLALKRAKSNLWRCADYLNNVSWVDQDDPKWNEIVIDFNPDVFIHCAWSGVAADDRLAWESQFQNLELLLSLLELAKQMRLTRFIGLGSQAEYGTFSGKINETAIAKPNTAYGTIKLMAYNLVDSFCSENNIEWFWLRLFPIFGPKEDLRWLIPSVIQKISVGKEIDLTPGDQRYAYLFIEDFTKLIVNIALKDKHNANGLFNISSTTTVSLKELVETIRNKVNKTVKLNFGALPYRHYQTMHMEGDMTKYQDLLGLFSISDFNENINKTIDYYLSKF